MTAIPSAEAILLEIWQSFGLNHLQSSQKKRFAELENKLSTYSKITHEILTDIFDALDCRHDSELLGDLLGCAMEAIQLLSVVENNVRTYGANARQIAWHLLGHQFAPYLGRAYAFWSLYAPVAPGLSGGDLWFVPCPSPDHPDRLRLPVQTTVEWWLDLLDCGLDDIWPDDDAGEGRVRNLQNWRAGRLPTPTTIGSAFDPKRRFTYYGAFDDIPNELPDAKFQRSLAFVEDQKKLDAIGLAKEIPHLPSALFKAALSGVADEEEKRTFADAVAQRWQKPTTATVRRRFRLARAIQDAHARLAEFICPAVDCGVADPAANKILQIWALFTETYRLTVQAGLGCQSESEANARFAASVPDWLAKSYLRSVMLVAPDARENFARWLSGRFREIGTGDEVGDLFARGELTAGKAARLVDSIADEERKHLEVLLTQVGEALDAGRAAEVQDLLQHIETHPRSREFAADICLLRGRHELNSNNFEIATKMFQAAFDECWLGGFGDTRKTAAYACLGAAMAFDYYTEKFERYCRVISTSLIPSEQVGHPDPEYAKMHDIEALFFDLAVKAEEGFWNDLYRPYPGVACLQPPAISQMHQPFEGLYRFMLKGDGDAVQRWLKDNTKLVESRLRGARGDTFFLLMLKFTNTRKRKFRAFSMQRETEQVISEFDDQQSAGMRLLAEKLSTKALDNPDFKKQTPLMLAADEGAADLVRALLDRGVAFDAQDYLGRTALHAAAACPSVESYSLILAKGADPTRKTRDGLSPLHTAVKFGLVEAVGATLDKWSDRYSADELTELLAVARDIDVNYKRIRPEMAAAGRRLAPKPAYRMIADRLEQTRGRLRK